MRSMRNIEIDFDIHKLIEKDRRNFEETPNTVLRRLLGLSVSREQTTGPTGQSNEENQPMEGAWTGKGITLPAGTQLRMNYLGQQYFGVIKDASWFVGEKRFLSPSAAAGKSVRTKSGYPTLLNGWNYWQVKRPSDERWQSLKALRNSV